MDYDNYPFEAGREVHALFLSEDSSIRVGQLGCKRITLVMCPGQMANVPWYRVESEDRETLYNGALVEAVHFEGRE